MTPEIERLAKEAGLWSYQMIDQTAAEWVGTPEQLAKFAALVAEDAIEQMRAVADTYICPADFVYAEAAAAIRAKFARGDLKDAAK